MNISRYIRRNNATFLCCLISAIFDIQVPIQIRGRVKKGDIPMRDTPYNSVASFSARLLSLARVTLAVLVLIYMPAAACGPGRPRPAVSDGRLPRLALEDAIERTVPSFAFKERERRRRSMVSRGPEKHAHVLRISSRPLPPLSLLTSRFISLRDSSRLPERENSLKSINLRKLII